MKKVISIALVLVAIFVVSANAKPKYDWLTIQSVGISERIQFADYGMDTQIICDKTDRAVVYRYRGSYGIADHNYQGFRNLHKVKKGDKATVTLFGKTRRYTCIKAFKGYNRKQYLTDKNGNIVELKKNQIQMYTCIGRASSRQIYITIWGC